MQMDCFLQKLKDGNNSLLNVWWRCYRRREIVRDPSLWKLRELTSLTSCLVEMLMIRRHGWRSTNRFKWLNETESPIDIHTWTFGTRLLARWFVFIERKNKGNQYTRSHSLTFRALETQRILRGKCVGDTWRSVTLRCSIRTRDAVLRPGDARPIASL